jgi:hypothetical protein
LSKQKERLIKTEISRRLNKDNEDEGSESIRNNMLRHVAVGKEIQH